MNYDPDYEVEESAGDSPSQWLNFDDCEDEDGRPRRWKKAKKSKASPVQRLQQQLQLGPRQLCESYGILLCQGFEEDAQRL